MQCVFLYPFTEVDLRFFKGPSSLILGFAEVLTTGLNSFRNRKNAPYRKKKNKTNFEHNLAYSFWLTTWDSGRNNKYLGIKRPNSNKQRSTEFHCDQF